MNQSATLTSESRRKIAEFYNNFVRNILPKIDEAGVLVMDYPDSNLLAAIINKNFQNFEE